MKYGIDSRHGRRDYALIIEPADGGPWPQEMGEGYVGLRHMQTFAMRLGNPNPVRADAEVKVNGKSVGTFRLPRRSRVLGPVVPPPNLGENLDFVAGNRPQRFAEVDVRAVQIGEVETLDAPVVRVAKERDQLFEAEPRLVRLPIAAVDAGALREPRESDAGLAQWHQRRWRHRVGQRHSADIRPVTWPE